MSQTIRDYKGQVINPRIGALTQDASDRYRRLMEQASVTGKKPTVIEQLNAIDPSGNRAADYENQQYMRRKAYRAEEMEKSELRARKLEEAAARMKLQQLNK